MKQQASHEEKFFPPAFPYEWASDWGEDTRGIWVAFTYRGVRQGFRWINPGRFAMGSPQEEVGRDDDEHLHDINLTRGFWMAETTCCQALWQAVMEQNPSHFKGDDLPVETVSWDDAVAFIKRLNDSIPELQLRLPSEAEWEYACRADTQTPFSFGANVSPDQVNYDGNFPYAGGKKGRYREKTLPVKALPANNWGLYQMHGNVWEWCAGWYDSDLVGPAINPMGPTSGGERVLRGGCWIFDGRDVRAAYRGMDRPDRRDSDTGFRLARGL